MCSDVCEAITKFDNDKRNAGDRLFLFSVVNVVLTPVCLLDLRSILFLILLQIEKINWELLAKMINKKRWLNAFNVRCRFYFSNLSTDKFLLSCDKVK